jgi:hypothetical protein
MRDIWSAVKYRATFIFFGDGNSAEEAEKNLLEEFCEFYKNGDIKNAIRIDIEEKPAIIKP